VFEDTDRQANQGGGIMANPTDKSSTDRAASDAENAYMRGGKGRKDEVGKSGIYPASAENAPADAEIRGQDELVKHSNDGSKSRKQS
jgi:hypothetical protein